MHVEQTAGSPRPELVRSNEVWFEDGTVVLQAEKTLFRVYRGVLAAQSPIFRDMFAIPQPPTGETYEGFPLVILPDSSDDLRLFLLATHDAGYFTNSPVDGMNTLAGLLRLSRKYEVDHIRSRMISILKCIYPSTLSAFLAREPPPGFVTDGCSDFIALNLALEKDDILPILPGVYYACACYRAAELLDAPIGIAEKKRCLAAVEGSTDGWCKSIHGSLFHRSAKCLDVMQCSTNRLAWLATHDFPGFDQILSTNFSWDAVGLCGNCVVEARTKFSARREDFWAYGLTLLLGLPN
ncbi:hypothetical protein FB451DRAFT_1272563 [Mycena latifolia]|nr:hypothetical protein FB451DRAFT_1272563 [Mycena latifolia]